MVPWGESENEHEHEDEDENEVEDEHEVERDVAGFMKWRTKSLILFCSQTEGSWDDYEHYRGNGLSAFFGGC